MPRGLWSALIIAAMALLLSIAGRAALDIEAQPQMKGGRELIVFETDGCLYCGLFRRDVLPDYLKSQRAADVPIRFVDVNKAGPLGPSLSSPLTIVPTVVLMVEGREAARITGYTGPETFFHMVSHMLAVH